MRTLCTVLPLVPIAVGDAISRAAWAPHVTAVGDVRVPDSGLDAAVAVVRAVAGRTEAVRLVVGDEAAFGPDGDVRVDLVEGPGLRPLHDALLDGFAGRVDGSELVAPQWARDGYRPHRTVVPGPRPAPGDPLLATTLALVELDPDGGAGLGVVVSIADLGVALPAPALGAADVLDLLDVVDGTACWVIGGWGVDALAGRATRPHHDLDLLVLADDVGAFRAAIEAAGFTVRSVWTENRWTAADDRWVPSAFVASDARGREVDVHAVDPVDGRPVPRSSSTVGLPRGALDGRGTIGGRAVACATAEAQLVMHAGYPLPERQRGDLALLRELVAP